MMSPFDNSAAMRFNSQITGGCNFSNFFVNINDENVKYFDRMAEKIPELERLEGNAGLPFCPLGKANFKNINS